MNNRKYLAQWVQVLNSNTSHDGKVGVVMDEEYLHNGIMCCRIVCSKENIAVESRYLKKVQV
jgi:hypothetical protein